MNWKRFLFQLFAFAVVVPPACAQEDTCLRRTLPLTFVLPAGTRSGQVPRGDLQAEIRKKPIKILSVVPDDRPHRIVILLDASGSMLKLWTQALSAASFLAGSSLPNTQLALVIFGKEIKQRIDFSEGQDAIKARLQELRTDSKNPGKLVHGLTAILDGIQAGMELLGPATSADSIYLISDAGDNASHADIGAVTALMTSKGVRFFATILLDESAVPRATPEEIAGPYDLVDLAKKTGGDLRVVVKTNFGTPKQIASLSTALHVLHTEMVHNFRLEVELPEPLSKPHSWELKLTGESAKQWAQLQYRYPTVLAPCEP